MSKPFDISTLFLGTILHMESERQEMSRLAPRLFAWYPIHPVETSRANFRDL